MDDIEFFALIDRLEEISAINHPDRLWSPLGKVAIEESWNDKREELKQRVVDLEEKLKENEKNN